MSIDLFSLPGEEFALAWAVEGMTCQWAWSDAPPNEQSQLAQKAFAALRHYDLWSVVADRYRSNEIQSSNWFKLDERDRLLRNYKYWGKISFDRKLLNKRSEHLLTILAKLADEFLMTRGHLWHDSMSAGQAAWGELRTYSLIFTDDQGCGYWTEAGLETLVAFAELGGFPE